MRVPRLLSLTLVGLGFVFGAPRVDVARGAPGVGRTGTRTCRSQKVLPFLVRKNFLRAGATDAQAHARAVRWRAEKYGHVPGLGLEGYNREPVSRHVRTTRFMGLPITMHEKVIPRLACVEHRLQQACRAPRDAYEPRAIGGLRTLNTYHQGEVSNHLFGIAVDIDPDRNPCCHCVDPWPEHRYCRKTAHSVYERTELPRCWIKVFEQAGFYWLGHDQLEDTMHFEYLADPDARR